MQHYLLGLFAVANNFPALAPFLALSMGLSRFQKLGLITIGSAGAFIIMTTSMLAGTAILGFFGISISAFQIAGGILLGGTGMSMLNAKGAGDVHGKEMEKPAIDRSTLVSTMIVPVTLPLTTGAGNDVIDTGGGNDTVDAGAGDDVIYQKDAGSDVVDGGEGNDLLVLDYSGETSSYNLYYWYPSRGIWSNYYDAEGNFLNRSGVSFEVAAPANTARWGFNSAN